MNDPTLPRKPSPPPGDYGDEIPVEELIRVTREFTRRITNQDRQRLALALRDSGHSRRIQIDGPVLLQQFFAGEIDLDNDLARRFLNAPLVSHARFGAEGGEVPGSVASATLSSQDDSTIMAVDAYGQGDEASLDFSFTLFSALGLRFRLNGLSGSERAEWIDLMRRQDVIAFLWTRDRWDQPYLIFVVREYYGRVYAFSPAGIEAAIRLTPDMITGLVDWLEGVWFPEAVAARQAAPARPVSRPLRRLVMRPSQPEATGPESVVPEPTRPTPDEPAFGEPESGEMGSETPPASDLEW